jgi:hypothetical protein
VEVSTAIDLGSLRDGVWRPGVDGGVNCGERRLVGIPGVDGWERFSRSDQEVR